MKPAIGVFFILNLLYRQKKYFCASFMRLEYMYCLIMFKYEHVRISNQFDEIRFQNKIVENEAQIIYKECGLFTV